MKSKSKLFPILTCEMKVRHCGRRTTKYDVSFEGKVIGTFDLMHSLYVGLVDPSIPHERTFFVPESNLPDRIVLEKPKKKGYH